jgi:hypothetical protein
MPRLAFTSLVIAALGGPTFAQSDISPVNKFCWQENTGWMNWRDANGGLDGVRDGMTFLAGFVWSENVGWINLGVIPADGVRYANTSGLDFGVNVGTDSTLSGMAWSENAGWLNFAGGSYASPPNPPRLDPVGERFYGYVWGENIGWVNLDLAIPGQFVQRTCYANCDGSTTQPVLNANDFQCFLNAFASASPAANCDKSAAAPTLNANDFMCFLNAFATGCP